MFRRPKNYDALSAFAAARASLSGPSSNPPAANERSRSRSSSAFTAQPHSRQVSLARAREVSGKVVMANTVVIAGGKQ